MPKWNRENLHVHFNKRVRKDSACLQDVLGRPVSSITQDDYERESMKVLSAAWICYAGQGLNNRLSGRGGIAYYDPANHFVDDRLMITIVSRGNDSVLTCYHEDFDRRHRYSQKKFEQMIRYVEHLGNQRRGDMLRKFSVERFVPPVDITLILKAELDRVKAIPERQASLA